MICHWEHSRISAIKWTEKKPCLEKYSVEICVYKHDKAILIVMGASIHPKGPKRTQKDPKGTQKDQKEPKRTQMGPQRRSS